MSLMVNITSSVNSRERSGINTILHELNPLFTINVTMRDIKSKNVYSRVNSKATTLWRKTESANGVHLEVFFFFNDTATTEIYTLSLHDALPIFQLSANAVQSPRVPKRPKAVSISRSEEHTSELQSHHDLVCRLLLEKKKKK